MATPRKRIVRERRIRPDEDIVFQNDTIPEIDTAFNSNTIANFDVILDERMIADSALSAYDITGEYVGKGPNSRILPYRGPVFYNRLGMNECL